MKAIKPVKIPVLMYHAVTQNGVKAENAVHISAGRFYEQMKWLSDEGYKTLRADDFFKQINSKEKAGQKQVFITFDDGYFSQLKEASPVLEKFGFNATLFLTTAAAGKPSYENIFPNSADCPPDDRPLSWPELRFMQNGLWDIEAHGCLHRRLATLSEEEIVHELKQSRLTIEKALQKEVLYYAYPYGSYKTFVLDEVLRQRYKAAFAVHPGMATGKQDFRRYHRIEINNRDTPASFRLKMQTGYSSVKQKRISAIRNLLFLSPKIKDFLMRAFTQKIN